MSRARSVADLGNQNVLDLNANDGTLKVGAGVTIENTGEVQFAGIVTAATVQIGAATTLHSTGLDLGAGNINSHNITSTGNLSVDGNVSVGGTLTYEDVTSIDSVGIITARNAIILSDDNAIHFRGATDSDKDAILRASASGGQLLINSRNDTILNIDSNNDSTDAHFAVAHGAATGSSTELFRVQENGRVGIGTDNPDELLEVGNGTVVGGLKISGQSSSVTSDGLTVDWESSSNSTRIFSEPSSGGSSAIKLFTTNSGTRAEKLRIHSDGMAEIFGSGPGGVLQLSSTDQTISAAGEVFGSITFKANDASTGQTGVFAKIDAASNRLFDGDNASGMDLRFYAGDKGDGVDTPPERLRIASNGRIGINRITPSYMLDIIGNSSTGANCIRIVDGAETGHGSHPSKIVSGGTYYQEMQMHSRRFVVHTYDGSSILERLRITSGGKVLVNTTTSRIFEDASGNGPTPNIQIEGTNSDASLSITSAGTADIHRAGTLMLGRHRNSTIGATPTIVQLNDRLGSIVFAGGDGSDMRSKGAIISAICNESPSSSQIPGKLEFSTTNYGDGEAPESRFVIDCRGSFHRKYRRLTTSGSYDAGTNRGYHSSATGSVRFPGSVDTNAYFSIIMPSYYSSGSVPGTVKISVQYATYHAAGSGGCESIVHLQHGSNGGRRLNILHFRKLSQWSSGGWFYSLPTGFNFQIYHSTNGEADAAIVGRVTARTGNGSSYDGSAYVHIRVETSGGWANHPEPRLVWHGNSAPSGLSGEKTAQNYSYS